MCYVQTWGGGGGGRGNQNLMYLTKNMNSTVRTPLCLLSTIIISNKTKVVIMHRIPVCNYHTQISKVHIKLRASILFQPPSYHWEKEYPSDGCSNLINEIHHCHLTPLDLHLRHILKYTVCQKASKTGENGAY